jgi:hypothetical protein
MPRKPMSMMDILSNVTSPNPPNRSIASTFKRRRKPLRRGGRDEAMQHVIASTAKQSNAKHRPEQSRGLPRCTQDDPRSRIRWLRRLVPTRLSPTAAGYIRPAFDLSSGRK